MGHFQEVLIPLLRYRMPDYATDRQMFFFFLFVTVQVTPQLLWLLRQKTNWILCLILQECQGAACVLQLQCIVQLRMPKMRISISVAAAAAAVLMQGRKLL